MNYDRKKEMAILLCHLGFSENEFNIHWKLGIETLEELFINQNKE